MYIVYMQPHFEEFIKNVCVTLHTDLYTTFWYYFYITKLIIKYTNH